MNTIANDEARVREVLARYDTFIADLARKLARAEPDFQEDLVQEARIALADEALRGEVSAPWGQVVALNAMQHARRGELRRRHQSLGWTERLERRQESAADLEAA